VGFPREMLGQFTPDELVVQHRERKIFNLQSARFEPRRDWHTKAFFCAMKNVIGQNIFERFLEEIFCRATTKFIVARKPSSKIKRSHPYWEPKPAFIREPTQRALDFQIQTHVRVRHRQPIEQRFDAGMNGTGKYRLIKLGATQSAKRIIAGKQLVSTIAAK